MAGQVSRKTSYGTAVRKFLKGADWLSDLDAPAVAALQHAAAELDEKGTQAALLAQFRLIFSGLAAGRPDVPAAPPAAPSGSNPVADILDGRG